MKRYITILALMLSWPIMAQEPADTLHHNIESIEITASLKNDRHETTNVATTTLNMRQLELRGVDAIKEMSLIAPNFYQPDYGSSITSSIYVRGFGSRIDQPVLGVTIDDIPMMNKNVFDFDFYDIRRIELLRGPQGTLYGRNTSGGVINIQTLSPLEWQGFRAIAEYSTLTSYRATASYYTRLTNKLGVSVAATYNHDGGFFRNTYTDDMCDWNNSASARVRVNWIGNRGWNFDNILTAGYTNEGGYAYHPYDPTTDSYSPIAYNDPSGYERLTLSEGFIARYLGQKIRLQSTTSYQFLDDRMTLDQDFSPKSMFTMQQMQREHSITEDIVIRNADTNARYQWLCGVFGFAKWLDMSSPVTFKKDGINELILGNINNGLHTVFPDNNMTFGTDEFVIASDFFIPTIGAALYHQSAINLGRWKLTAGIRFDYEYTSMRYHSHTTIPYCFDLTMIDYKELRSDFKGSEKQFFFKILPKLAAEYNMDRGNIYATIARGYKSGGYNTQIFSDILQSIMMQDMLDDLGVQLDSVIPNNYDSASATRYKPETSWNFEVGTHLRPAIGLTLDASLFWIECFDQQVTILPKGNSTGRMMSNAARARSYGMELSVAYNYNGFNIRGDYGYTNARFRKYNDGTADYAGNRLPYAPENTVSLMASYSWAMDNSTLRNVTIAADWRASGSIYWNEANTLRQPLYSTLGAQLTLQLKDLSITLWGRNLTNTDYNVFYFKSVGKEFFSKGAPIHGGVRLNINL